MTAKYSKLAVEPGGHRHARPARPDRHRDPGRFARRSVAARVRLHDQPRPDARRLGRALHRRARPQDVRGRPRPRRRLPRPAGRVLRYRHASAFHDAAGRAAGGGVRPARRRARHARGALQHRHDDVGDALLVDAALARLRRRGRARRRLRQMEGRRPAARDRRAARLSAGDLRGGAARRACSSMPRR